MKNLARLMVWFIPFFWVSKVDAQNEHPYYLHALEDLRAARWLIHAVPGNNWKVNHEEEKTIKFIEDGIQEINLAAIRDNKDLDDHVGVDDNPNHMGRLNAAMDFLRKAKKDVRRDEDNKFAENLQDKSLHHIRRAIKQLKRAIRNSEKAL